MWVIQRNWQARRDVGYELARKAASFRESVIGLLAVWQTMHKTPGMMAIPNPKGATALERHKNATENFWQAKLVAALLLDQRVITQVEGVESTGRVAVALTQSPDALPGEQGKRVLAMREAVDRGRESSEMTCSKVRRIRIR